MLFFDAYQSTYTLPGIQNGIKYQVSISQSFFDNINIPTDTAFTNTTELPYLKYKGKFYSDGETFVGEDVTTYEIKYPNFVRLYKVVEDIDRPFNKAEEKGEEGGADASITEEEEVAVDQLELFKAQIRNAYKSTANSIIAWIPRDQSAFWLNSDYVDDWWTISAIDNSQTITINLEGTNKTITFKRCEIKKTGLRSPIFNYNYSFFSALSPVRQMPDNRQLTIGLDANLNPTQINNIKKLLGQSQTADNTLLPQSEMEIGGLYVESLFPENTVDANYNIINNSDIEVNITISKIKSAPDIKFDDFSKSSVIKIINRK